MKILIQFLFLIYSVWSFGQEDQELTKIFLIRHTETLDNGTRDPDLSKKGKERAIKWADVLGSEKIDKVYATDLKRTQALARIIADSQGIEKIISYERDLDVDEMNDESGEFSYEILPNKTIMGYDCKGVKAANEELEMTMYFTTDAEVSFSDIYKSDKANIPKGLKKYFKEGENTLMLELEMVNFKKSKLNATMQCVGLEEVQKVIYKSDYESMNYETEE